MKKVLCLMMKKTIFVIITLIASYVLLKFGLFGLYKSYDAPKIAMLPSVLGMVLTILFNCSATMIGTSLGYITSFILAQIFKTEYIDPEKGNALYSNWLVLWLVIYLGIIGICFIIDLCRNKKLKE